MGAIEDIILARDPRGIGVLRPHLPEDFCTDAAQFILERPPRALIATGFYVLKAGAGETDGPPGAVAIGNALAALGYEVTYVTDGPNVDLVRVLASPSQEVIDFPIGDHRESRAFATDICQRLSPTVLVAIERVGFSEDGLYHNWLGHDVSHTMAKLDYLFLGRDDTVGIGDGGNEIGMGLVTPHIQRASLHPYPCTTPATKLTLGGTSNWGGYGLVAALSLLCMQNLLPSVQQEWEWVQRAIGAGAVDGQTGESTGTVDTLEPEETARVLEALHQVVDRATRPRR